MPTFPAGGCLRLPNLQGVWPHFVNGRLAGSAEVERTTGFWTRSASLPREIPTLNTPPRQICNVSGAAFTWKNGMWRRGWDSNPRYPCRYAAFRVRCIRPLCHLSACANACVARNSASMTEASHSVRRDCAYVEDVSAYRKSLSEIVVRYVIRTATLWRPSFQVFNGTPNLVEDILLPRTLIATVTRFLVRHRINLWLFS
jgi:hypothetical protein